MGDERARLLALTADYLLEHGVGELTLRRLGQHIGTNNRMLLYYFGSKEQLISDALQEATLRFPGIVGALDALDDRRRPIETRLQAAWRSISTPGNLVQIRLFFEVFGLAAHDPGRFGGYLGRVSHEWVERVAAALEAEGVPPRQASATARGIVACWRGLQFDLLGGAPKARVNAAHAELVGAIVAGALAAAGGSEPAAEDGSVGPTGAPPVPKGRRRRPRRAVGPPAATH